MAGLGAGALLLFVYGQGGAGWPLGFVALLPWLWLMDAGADARPLWRTLGLAWAMCVAFTAALFGWFGFAMSRYAELPPVLGLALLLLAAPLLQPQLWVYLLVRDALRRHHGAAIAGALAAAAWVATEWALPKLLGDTLGHGLYPATLLRQAADLGGAAGLTLLLLLTHEALLAAWRRRRSGPRALVVPLGLAAAVPLALAGYGLVVTSQASDSAARVRVGLVQSNIVDYERLRRERGAGAVVREVLDLHYAMSHDAVVRQGAQALLWSETVYPTTFARPKSEAGAELDREIVGVVNAAGVPLVFGTYDRDEAGEYNAAAFVAPERGLVGMYRKTRLFPFTEALPAWLDSPGLRSALPWAGQWRPGNGARVFPLRLADGREIPVLPLICLDDVDTRLGVDGARLGAQLILAMSNDSWFTEHPQGAQLHLAVAAFRSIETRLPQFRVTSNGHSAVIDARGEVLAGSRMGERQLVVGELPVREVRPTLMVAWGDWVGRCATALLALLAAWRAATALRARFAGGASHGASPASASTQEAGAGPVEAVVLTSAQRWTAAALRLFAGGSLTVLAVAVLGGEGALAAGTLAPLRAFVALFVAPELAAALLLHAGRATLHAEAGQLVLERGGQRHTLALQTLAALQAWRLPLPAPGLSLRLASGGFAPFALARVDPAALQRLLAAAAPPAEGPAWALRHAQASRSARPLPRLQHPLAKFVLLPFALAVPAFGLHQHIAFGSALGELQVFGALAFAKGFALWWASWAAAVVGLAAVLRAAVELAMLAAAAWLPKGLDALRATLERAALALLYLGLPGWLALRLLG